MERCQRQSIATFNPLTGDKSPLRSQGKRHGIYPCPRYLSLVVVAERPVVKACSHATILEICAQIRTDTGLAFLASRIAPCQNEPLGKPRLTLVSDGNPLRRLLLRSKLNSVSTAVSPFGWICPSHPEGETAYLILSH